MNAVKYIDMIIVLENNTACKLRVSPESLHEFVESIDGLLRKFGAILITDLKTICEKMNIEDLESTVIE